MQAQSKLGIRGARALQHLRHSHARVCAVLSMLQHSGKAPNACDVDLVGGDVLRCSVWVPGRAGSISVFGAREAHRSQASPSP